MIASKTSVCNAGQSDFALAPTARFARHLIGTVSGRAALPFSADCAHRIAVDQSPLLHPEREQVRERRNVAVHRGAAAFVLLRRDGLARCLVRARLTA